MNSKIFTLTFLTIAPLYCEANCYNGQKSSSQTVKKNDKGEQLSISDIKTMSQAGVSDDKIIGTIHSTGSVFHLSSTDVEDLKNDGVSQRVIDAMLQTGY